MDVAPVFRGRLLLDGGIAWRDCTGSGNRRGAGHSWEAGRLYAAPPGNHVAWNASLTSGGEVTVEALEATARWGWPSHRIMREWRQNVLRSGDASRQHDVTTGSRGGRGCRSTTRSRPIPSRTPSLNLSLLAVFERGPLVLCRSRGSIGRKRAGWYLGRSRGLARACDCRLLLGSGICISRTISLGVESPILFYRRTMIANPKLSGHQARNGKPMLALNCPRCKHERDLELEPDPDAEPHPDPDPDSAIVAQSWHDDHVAATAANVDRRPLTLVNDAHSHGSFPSPSPPSSPSSPFPAPPPLAERDHTVLSLAGVPASSLAEGLEFAQSYGAQVGCVSSSEGGVVGNTPTEAQVGGVSSSEGGVVGSNSTEGWWPPSAGMDVHHRNSAKDLGAALHSERDSGSECTSGLGSAAASIARHQPRSPPVTSVPVSDGVAKCPRTAWQPGTLPPAVGAASASSDSPSVSFSASVLPSEPTLGTGSESGCGASGAPTSRMIYKETQSAGSGFGSASSREHVSATMSGSDFERGSRSDPKPGFLERVSEPPVTPPGPEIGPGGSLLGPGSHEDSTARPLRRQNCSSRQWEDLLTIPDRLVRDIGFAIACPCLLLNSEEVPIVDELMLGSSGSAWTSMIQWLKGLDSTQVAEWFAAKKRTRLGDHFADCMEYTLRFSPYFHLDHLWISQPVHWRTMRTFHHGPKVRIQQAENDDVNQATNTCIKDLAPDDSQCNACLPKDAMGEADEIHQALDVSESCSPGPEVACLPASRQDCDGNNSACIPDNVRNQVLNRDLQESTVCSTLTSPTEMKVSSGSPGHHVREMQLETICHEMEGSVLPPRIAVAGESLVNNAASIRNSCNQDDVRQGSITGVTLPAGVRLTEQSEPAVCLGESHRAVSEANESAELPSVLSSAENRASLAPAENIGRQRRRGRGRGEITKTIGEFDILFVKAVGVRDEGEEETDSSADRGLEAPRKRGGNYHSDNTGNPLIVDSMKCQISAEGMVVAQPRSGDLDFHSDIKAVDGKLQSAAPSLVPCSNDQMHWDKVYDEGTRHSGKFEANASTIDHASAAESDELTEKRHEDTTVKTAGWQDNHDIDMSNDGRSRVPGSCSGSKGAVEIHHWELSVKYFLFCVPNAMDRGEGEEEEWGKGRQELQGRERDLLKMTNFFGPHAEEILSSRKNRLYSQVRLSTNPRALRFLMGIYAKAEEERKHQQEAYCLTDARSMIARSFTETVPKSGVYLRTHLLQTTLHSGLQEEGSKGKLPASAGSRWKGGDACDMGFGRPAGFGKGLVAGRKGAKSNSKKGLSANKPGRNSTDNTKTDNLQEAPPRLSHLQSLGRPLEHLSNLMSEETNVVNVVPSSEEAVSFALLDKQVTLGMEQKDRTVPIYMDHWIHTVQGVEKADYRGEKGEGNNLLGLQGDIVETVSRADKYESEPGHTAPGVERRDRTVPIYMDHRTHAVQGVDTSDYKGDNSEGSDLLGFPGDTVKTVSRADEYESKPGHTAQVTSSRLSEINKVGCLMQAMQDVNTTDFEGGVPQGNNLLLVHEGDADGGAVSGTDKKEDHIGLPAVMTSARLSVIDKSVEASRDVQLVLSTGSHGEAVESVDTLNPKIEYEIVGPGVVKVNELTNIQVWPGAVSKGYLFYEYNLWVELQKQDWEREIAQSRCQCQMENRKQKLRVHKWTGTNESTERVHRNQKRKNAELNPNHWKGWWTRDICRIILQLHHHDSRWYIIPKMEWLAPIVVHSMSHKDAATGVLDSDQLMAKIEALSVEAEKGLSPRKHRALVAELRWREGLVGGCGDNLDMTDQRAEGLSPQHSSQDSLAAVLPEVRGEYLNSKGAWVEVSRGFVVEKTWRETNACMPYGLGSIDSGGGLAATGDYNDAMPNCYETKEGGN